MLARQFRITKKEDFEAVYRRGRSFSLGMVSVVMQDNNASFSRFGVVVSTKFSKHAVERNRIKRQIRAIVEKNRARITKRKDIVISARKTGPSKSYTSLEIEKNIMEILKRAGLISEKKK